MFQAAVSVLFVPIILPLPGFSDSNTPPAWTLRPFSEVKSELEKAGWKHLYPGNIIKFYDGQAVQSFRVGNGPKHVLQNGRFRESNVVVTAPIVFFHGETKVVRFQETQSQPDRDKVVFGFKNDQESTLFLEKGPIKVTSISVFNKWPDDKPAEDGMEENPQQLSSQPARMEGGTFTLSMEADQGEIRKLVYLQRKIELMDGEKVLAVWYDAAFHHAQFVMKLDGGQKTRKKLNPR